MAELVKVYRRNSIVNEFKVDDLEEGKRIGRQILSEAGIRNTREFFNSLVGYTSDGYEDIHISIRKID